MPFSVNTNLEAMHVYNALAEVNAKAQKAQLRIATTKRINHVADDTSGYRVGKSLESKNEVLKAQLNNATSAKNYLSIAESALDNVDTLLKAISAKSLDSQDPTKNKAALANDIRALANEIDATVKSTTFNGRQLLAKTDGKKLDSSDRFDLGGQSSFTVDFAGDSYLKADDLYSVLHGGGTVTEAAPANYFEGSSVQVYSGSNNIIANNGPATTSGVKVTFSDGTQTNFSVSIAANDTVSNLFDTISSGLNGAGISTAYVILAGPGTGYISISPSKSITSINTTSGFDIIAATGIKYGNYTASGSSLLSADDNEVLSSAANLSGVMTNVKNSIGRIGNLLQSADIKSDFLTSSITNNTSSISRLFDADIAEEQLSVTKNTIGSQIATTMLSQSAQSAQSLLSLFR